MARLLIVGGGCRGTQLAREVARDGHAVRITTRGHGPRAQERRAEIEAVGAECWIGTPDRLATLRAALEGVTVVCWLLATAQGGPEEIKDLHGSRLEFFLGQTIDTTVRGFIYEDGGAEVPPQILAEGRRLVSSVAQRNLIPTAFVSADPAGLEQWLSEAQGALHSLLG